MSCLSELLTDGRPALLDGGMGTLLQERGLEGGAAGELWNVDRASEVRLIHEEYADACDILGADMAGGGVRASSYRNKMNEARPHRAWAERTMRRARVFGVAAEDVSFVDLLAAGIDVP